MIFLNIEKKRDFLINLVYWLVVAAAVYLAMEYLLPISVPFLLGSLIAWVVIKLSGKLRCTHKLFRIGLTILIYGVLALLITLAAVKSGGHGIALLFQVHLKQFSDIAVVFHDENGNSHSKTSKMR